jgi:hypothetical protein
MSDNAKGLMVAWSAIATLLAMGGVLGWLAGGAM